ncbi:sialate:O-sulfotransferase 1-like [Palaemon carinicauda]|uniref:sialate:O-sulfotransferase 1-like n=1 Tax=Palaemon carinicauda TaxID=392227 RepID=UPI0035B57786
MTLTQTSVRRAFCIGCVLSLMISMWFLTSNFLHFTNKERYRFYSHARDKMQVVRDINSTSFRIWKKDSPTSPCYKYETRFAKGLKPVWLISFPGSGNTWIRYLLEGATGIFTGSIYNDEYILRAGYLGEFEDSASGRTLVQKTHETVLDFNLSSIILIRNPKKAIESFWNFLIMRKTGNPHVSRGSPFRFQKQEFHWFVNHKIVKWETLIIDHLLLSTVSPHIVYYENLKENTLFEIRRILEYLGLPIDEGRMQCLQSHLTGSFKRKGSEIPDPFTEKENSTFAVAVSSVRRIIKAFGYPEPPFYDGIDVL